MKKKRIISTICLGMMLCSTPSLIANAADEPVLFAGSGTSADPYQIDSAFRLRLLAEIANDPNTDYSKFRSAYYI